MYSPNDCNSILKYIDNKSPEDNKREPPKLLNKAIKEYSLDSFEVVILVINSSPPPALFTLLEILFKKLKSVVIFKLLAVLRMESLAAELLLLSISKLEWLLNNGQESNIIAPTA